MKEVKEQDFQVDKQLKFKSVPYTKISYVREIFVWATFMGLLVILGAW